MHFIMKLWLACIFFSLRHVTVFIHAVFILDEPDSTHQHRMVISLVKTFPKSSVWWRLGKVISSFLLHSRNHVQYILTKIVRIFPWMWCNICFSLVGKSIRVWNALSNKVFVTGISTNHRKINMTPTWGLGYGIGLDHETIGCAVCLAIFFSRKSTHSKCHIGIAFPDW